MAIKLVPGGHPYHALAEAAANAAKVLLLTRKGISAQTRAKLSLYA